LFDGYLSVGKRTHEYLRYFGVSDSRIWDAPHCVDNEFFVRAATSYHTRAGRAVARASWGLGLDEFVILFVGKLEVNKRPLDLIRAAARMEPRPQLLMVGAGEMEGECRAEAQRLAVSIAWAGFVNQSELGRAYGAADCLALPSCGESWGLVVNEALASGLPCVASDRVGCIPDLITAGETGEVFLAGDVLALVRALMRVRTRTQGGHDWAPACQRRAATYSFSAATTGLVAACRALTHRSAIVQPVAGRPRNVV
jgi:glycosyltransferase involved in cell wall biosynthesis